MLSGALVTLEVAVLSMVVGVALAVLLALAEDSKSRALRGLASGWVSIARNTPALFQVYMAYFGLGSIGVHLDSFPALLAGLAFNNAGYMVETFRGGMRAIPRTQIQAARSLGMAAVPTFYFIILPQLFRIVFHPMTNQMIWSILNSSFGIVVGLNSDLAGVTQELNVKTYRTFEFFLFCAGIYYVIAKFVTLGARALAWRLFRY